MDLAIFGLFYSSDSPPSRCPDNPFRFMKFLHTADWQLGKPFARVSDEKRHYLQQERFGVIARIGELAREQGAEFILVAGDVFDSPSASKATVASACSAIGQLGLPVIMIPGNHDHGGPGSLWDQAFFQQERQKLAPNLHVLLQPEPFELEQAVIFPCPLSRRAESVDTTAWLRSAEVLAGVDPAKPRIILAHGSTQGFASQLDEDEAAGHATNRIDLSSLPEAEYDYLALGDWHGTKKVAAKAWYSGTPELDRFPKGEENDPGNVLLVEVRRGEIPRITPCKTARFHWSELVFDFSDDASFAGLEERLTGMLGQRANEDLLRLHLTGALGIAAAGRLESLVESLEARLLRVKLSDATTIAPTGEEIHALTQRQADPLIARVAQRLVDRANEVGESADVARIALRELHAAVARGQ